MIILTHFVSANINRRPVHLDSISARIAEKNMFTTSPISENKYLLWTLLINLPWPKLTRLAGRHSRTQIHQEIHQLNGGDGGGGGGEGHNDN